ncbi:MAG TPA: carboxypeptidase-like regulatory domain-containing protein [Pyrinomonadaceae bacterium]|nr:carboxypeptidase regulatory-like domain-containing protein [Acidobacteriota bacterium]HQZ94795.1 carboxypeptidase-like regulatory domain-containing protein [Pyrinomonadaceae bacterium]
MAVGKSQLWQQTDASRVPTLGRRQLSPEKSVSFKLDAAALAQYMSDMPREFTNEARLKNVIVEIPMPDGTLQRFRIEDSPVLAFDEEAGIGIRNARVTMIGPGGTRRTATTSSFGVYSFQNVTRGFTYTITVSSKRYRFAPNIIVADDTRTDVDFVGLE